MTMRTDDPGALARSLARMLFAVLVGCFLSCCTCAHAATIPADAVRLQRDLIRTVHAGWGLDGPVTVFAAQIHQESGWRADARSGVGAQGLAQFMPATADWISELQPSLLGDRQPFNPVWSMRALVAYDRWLYQRVVAADECQRWAMTLSSYNGGLGWLLRDKTLAQQRGLNRNIWFGHVAKVNAGRTVAAWTENRAYPQRILYHQQPIYVSANWGAGVCL